MKKRVWVGTLGAVIFVLGFLAYGGWIYTQSPYRDLYIVMMVIGLLMVVAAKFVGWLER